FQPDQEQHDYHAELGKVQERFRIADKAQYIRPQKRTGNQVAEHRAETDTFRQGHDDGRGGEADCDVEAYLVHGQPGGVGYQGRSCIMSGGLSGAGRARLASRLLSGTFWSGIMMTSGGQHKDGRPRASNQGAYRMLSQR